MLLTIEEKKTQTELVLVSFFNHTRIIELETVGGTFHVETVLAHVNLLLDKSDIITNTAILQK